MLRGFRKAVGSALRYQFKDAIWQIKYYFGYYNVGWYRDLFSQAKSSEIAGEITPAYSILDYEDVARIRRINPGMKHIFLIRNPIDRAWSAIRYHTKVGKLSVDLSSDEEVIAVLKERGTILRGDYERTLETYLEYFDSKQILVCFYDAIQSDPVKLMSNVTTFLGVADFEEADLDNQKRVLSSPQSPIPGSVRSYLLEAYGLTIDRLSRTFGSYARVWQSEVGSSGRYPCNQLSSDELFPTFHP